MNTGIQQIKEKEQLMRITLACNLNEVVKVELATQQICEIVGINDEHTFMIILAVSEALTNIMVHGLSLSEKNNHQTNFKETIEAYLRYRPGYLDITLQDNGKAYPEEIVNRLHHGVAGDFHVPDDPLEIQDRGRGIDLILLAVENVTYQRENDINRLVMQFANR